MTFAHLAHKRSLTLLLSRIPFTILFQSPVIVRQNLLHQMMIRPTAHSVHMIKSVPFDPHLYPITMMARPHGQLWSQFPVFDSRQNFLSSYDDSALCPLGPFDPIGPFWPSLISNHNDDTSHCHCNKSLLLLIRYQTFAHLTMIWLSAQSVHMIKSVPLTLIL